MIVHEIQIDDTLDGVCSTYGADPGRVRRANGIPSTSDYLGVAGSRLRIPEGRVPPAAPGPTEEERRATLLRSFRLRHGLSAEDAGVFLRLAGWDGAAAEAEMLDVEADHERMGRDGALALGSEGGAVGASTGASASVAPPTRRALPDVGLGERWQSKGDLGHEAPRQSREGVGGAVVTPADGLRRRKAEV